MNRNKRGGDEEKWREVGNGKGRGKERRGKGAEGIKLRVVYSSEGDMSVGGVEKKMG